MKNDKMKLCCFTVNSTHASIIANNYIQDNVLNAKIIYIDKKEDMENIQATLSKYYSNLQDKMYYTSWLNENIVHDAKDESIVFVVHGEESFIEKVNKYLDISCYKSLVINCYEVSGLVGKVSDIITKHDLYINTSGVVNRQMKCE